MLETENIESVFEKIAPYNQQQIEEALVWLSHNKQFIDGVKYIYPNWSDKLIVEKLNSCNTCADFQVVFIEPMIKSLIENSIYELKINGFDTINKNDNYLYISNHRGIFLDSGLLQYTLYHRGYDFTEISLGDNLIVDDVMERVSKLNNMFTVFRSGTKLQLLQNAKNLSAYIRFSIAEKKVSSWIAQGNGRTKDGNDKTFPGLVKMLMMSGGIDLRKSLKELNIMISSVSYEYEPCALEKAIEMQTREETGGYEKAKYENINSIIKGVKEYKGNVTMHFEKLNIDAIDFSGTLKETIKAIVNEMDRTIYKNYNLFKNNYIAYDLLFETKEYTTFYTDEDLKSFKNHIELNSSDSKIQLRLLKMYANPTINKRSL